MPRRGINQCFLSFDATIKIEHLLRHADLLSLLRRTGCAFVISAVESLDDAVLARLAKGHTRADFERALRLMRAADIPLAPTWVPFHPWTTLESYLDLLASLVELALVEAVPPVQLVIRLLIPQASRLLELPELAPHVGPFDAGLLGHPWRHPDARVDALQKELEVLVAQGEAEAKPRAQIFAALWEHAHRAAGRTPPSLAGRDLGVPIPHLSEPWYCCAEPTGQQLEGF